MFENNCITRNTLKQQVQAIIFELPFHYFCFFITSMNKLFTSKYINESTFETLFSRVMYKY